VKPKLLALISTIIVLFLAIGALLHGTISLAADSPATGSLSGEVKLQGSPPKPTRIDMSTDPNCAKEHSGPATSEDVVTGADNHLENVIVYVAEGLGTQTFQPPAQPAVFEQKGCTYKPHVLAIQAGQQLQVVNADKTTHNIHPMPENNREWNKTQPPGVPIEESFAREEIAIPVKCNIHPWMHGYIAVFKHPFFAVTDKDGQFELKDIPAGSYTIKAWQEKLGTQTQKVTVEGGQSQTVEFVFKN
jgi:plastocyanin